MDPEQVNENCKAIESQPLDVPINTTSGLILINHKLGQGKLPQPGQQVTVRYKGKIDKRVFSKGILTSTFGQGESILGFEEGIATMRPGGIRTLWIKPELAYGAEGKGEKIPPNSTLEFSVELIRIGKRKRSDNEINGVPLPRAFQRKK